MEDFLGWIFGDAVAADRQLSLFTVPERRARRFPDIAQAAQVARKLSQTQDVYFGVGLVAGSPKGRGTGHDIAGLGALWADIDFAGAAHPGKSLPADDDDFQRLLAELPIAPSLVVDSGHGRHLYWLLHEPWLFRDHQDRARARRVCAGWHELVCITARRRGWALENLGDLARVLRLPETVNRKEEPPVPVRIVRALPDRRYAIEDFETFLPEEVAVVESPREVVPGECATPPPAERLAAALAESPLFQQTWERTRSDLADQSASAYDLSLATLAALRGWSDGEIASLLFAWRTQHGENPGKIQRADYLARTLQRARDAAQHSDQTPVDLSGFQVRSALVHRDEPPPPEDPDPGPLPESLCRIPGFVSEVMDHCLATAPYPNVPLAFCGALALQALLAGRKVRDEADNRSNIYLLALAFSSAGKDWPRKLNVKILHRVGLINCLGDKFASGEGIQDALFLSPAMLFQNDEIDGLLQSISKSRDARYENLMGTLLTMYSSANSVYPMRRKAGKEAPGVIDQPCLTIFGTAIPTHYYAALSERMLTNGFFARMLIVDSGRRSAGQEPGILAPSEPILTTARWWADFQPALGNLQSHHPEPATVPATDAAKAHLVESRIAAGQHYSRAESRGDAVGTTVWGRAQEQIRKLALLYAVSENHTSPQITEAGVLWASAFVNHLTHRMLFMANCHLSESEFDQRCKRVIEALQGWRREHGDTWMSFRDLARKFRWSRRDHDDIRSALSDQDRIETNLISTGGRPKLMYRLKALPEVPS